MAESLEWLWNHRMEPLGVLLSGFFLLVIGKICDGLARKLINNQIKRLLHIEDSELSSIKRRIGRIENKVDLLLAERGIRWVVDSNGGNPSPMHRKNVIPLFSEVTRHVENVRQFINWRVKQMQTNKLWITALVTWALSMIASKAGITFPEGTSQSVVDGVATIINGITVLTPVVLAILNRKKEVQPNVNAAIREDNK